MLSIRIKLLVLTALLCCILPQYSVAQIIDLCVDPGHGGSDPGAITHYDDWHEVDALRSGRSSCKGVGVQVPPSAFISSKVHWATDSCDCFHDPSGMKLWPT